MGRGRQGRAGRPEAPELRRGARGGSARRALWLALAVQGLAVQGACGGGARVELCGQIPEGGCPVGRGGTCEDRACRALYDCVDGAWTQKAACGPGSGGGGGGAAGGAGEGGQGGQGGQGPCTPSGIDREGERANCEPALQHPDCPAAVASCVETACNSECGDFFVCRAGGWEAVAHCSETGELVVE